MKASLLALLAAATLAAAIPASGAAQAETAKSAKSATAAAPADAAQAEQPDPAAVPVLKWLQEKGAVIHPLGRTHGLDGWLASVRGTMQILYTTPDGQAFVSGALFGVEGRDETAAQLQALRDKGFDLQAFVTATRPAPQSTPPKAPANTPGELLLSEFEQAHWIEAGRAEAPLLYMIVDPRCPYCKQMWNQLNRDYVATGALRIRLIPVAALGDESGRLAGVMMAAADPLAVWGDFVAGRLPASTAQGTAASEDAVAQNTELLQRWKITGTPFSAFRGRDGSVKILRELPDDLTPTLRDLGVK